MTVKFYDGTDHDGLFDILGKAFKVQADINTSRGTTIPADVLALIGYFNNLTLDDDLELVIQPITGCIPGYQSGGAGTMSTLQAFCQKMVIAMVNNDALQPDRTLLTALKELIRQMDGASASLDASAVTVAVTPGTNTGDAVILASKKRGDGLTQESMLAETIKATATTAALTASIQLLGQAKASSQLGQDWPLGSGTSKTLSAVDATSGSGSLLTNGGFETATDAANVPDGWRLSVGTPGTTCLMTVTEVQTVAISGTPTAGFYWLKFTAASGKVYTTAPLDYNATAADVQTALQALPGLSQVTVSSTGTTPNLTHTITFTGLGGDIAQLTSVDNTTGGTHAITHGTTTAGTAQVFAGGAAFYFVGNGSELTTIQQAVSLQPQTAYAVSLWAICDVIPGAGVITIDLVDGVGGTVVQDAQGANNSLTFNASSLTTSWQHLEDLQASECVFRTPAVLPVVCYFRIRISTAVTNTRKVFFDNVALAPMTELYAGGPLLAAFAGATSSGIGDSWSIATTNDRAGLVREWCQRNFDMATLGLMFPTSGSPTVPDSVVS